MTTKNIYKTGVILICFALYTAENTIVYSSEPSENKNYIISVSPRIGQEDISGLPDYIKGKTITYFDGLGREIQHVSYKQSPEKKSIVQPVVYDELGRKSIHYLPYETNSSGNNLSYKSDWHDSQKTYYGQLNESNESNHAYGRTYYENSPLNRVMSELGPGKNWHEAPSGKGKINYSYAANKSYDNIPKFSINSSGQLIPDGHYDSGSLYKRTKTDEDGREFTEWKDFQGRVIQTSQGKDALTATTIYVYDDFGLMRWVLPPKVVNLGSFNLTPGEGIAKDLCYYYKYDEKKRLIEKHIPGAGPVYYVYDNRDLLVMSQDGNQRSIETPWSWIIHKYDDFNRLLYSALVNISNSSHQDLQNDFKDNPEDVYNSYVNDSNKFAENIWDIYEFTGGFNIPGNWVYTSRPDLQDTESGSTYPDSFSNTHSLLTASRERIIESNGSLGNWLYSIYFYDDKGRMVQSYQHINENNHYLHNFSLISWAGDLIKNETRLHSIFANALTILTEHSYDHAGRLIGSTNKVTLTNGTNYSYSTQNDYDPLGRLIKETLNDELNTEYNYNIRNWITEIDNSAQGTEYFNMQLKYETADNHPQYAGNIASVSWANYATSYEHKYNYQYDALNRLIAANYLPYNRYSTSYQYDIQGNITNLTRRGMTLSETYDIIDDLEYHYYNNSNKLEQVVNVGISPEPDGFDRDSGFDNKGLIDGGILPYYNYDSNGNMIADYRLHRNISYNFLNLPSHIDNNNDQMLHYTYTASGQKLSQELSSGTGYGTLRRYAGPFVFVNDQLAWVNTGHGRVVVSGSGSLSAEFHVRDHLGNTRLALKHDSQGLSPIQYTDYYPFGKIIETLSNYNSTDGTRNRYLYNGKELQDDFDLNWYDYGARFYDPEIARWYVIDPLAELAPGLSPYRYGFNNPVRFIDPDGLFEEEPETDIFGRAKTDRWGNYISPCSRGNSKSDNFMMGVHFNSPPGTSGGSGARNVGSEEGEEDAENEGGNSWLGNGILDYTKASNFQKITHIMKNIRYANQSHQEYIDMRLIFSNYPKRGTGEIMATRLQIGKNTMSVTMEVATYNDMRINIYPGRIKQLGPFYNQNVKGIKKKGYWHMLELYRHDGNIPMIMIQTETKNFDVLYNFLYN